MNRVAKLSIATFVCVYIIMFIISNTRIKASIARGRLASYVGSAICLYLQSKGEPNIPNHYCVKSERTAFGVLYSIIPIVSIHDFELKESDAIHYIVVQKEMMTNKNFQEALLICKNPVEMLSRLEHNTSEIFRSTVLSYKTSIVRDVPNGDYTINIIYTACDIAPGPDCRECADEQEIERMSIPVTVK